jgi:hypothetical protein
VLLVRNHEATTLALSLRICFNRILRVVKVVIPRVVGSENPFYLKKDVFYADIR